MREKEDIIMIGIEKEIEDDKVLNWSMKGMEKS